MKDVDWNFFSYILRDNFKTPLDPFIHGEDLSCLPVFHSTVHWMWFLMLYSGRDNPTETEFVKPFSIEQFSHTDRKAGMFLAVEDTYHKLGTPGREVEDIHRLIVPGAFVILIDQGLSTDKLDACMTRRPDIEDEMLSYSMIKGREVLVYENF